MWSRVKRVVAASLLTLSGCDPAVIGGPRVPVDGEASARGGVSPKAVSRRAKAQTPTAEPKAPSACAADPLHPLVLGDDLKIRSAEVVVVHESATCALTVLADCHAHGAYAYTAVARRAGHSDDPALAWVETGQRVATAAPTELAGTCDGATHFVRRVLLGSADASACTAMYATEDEAAAAGCATPIELDLAPITHVEGEAIGSVFSAGFGANLWRDAATDQLVDAWRRDKRALDRALATEPNAAVKAAYRGEFIAVYKPHEAALTKALGKGVAPLPTDDAAAPPPPPPAPTDWVRLVADGGIDGLQLSYNGTGSGRVLASGEVGLTFVLPRIPAPNVGLAARGRFTTGPDLSRFQVGAGVEVIAGEPSAGAMHGAVNIGVFASYSYLIAANCKVSTNSSSSTSSTDAACKELTNIVATSPGGGDIRASVDYEFLPVDHLLLTAGGDVGFAFYSFTSATDPASTDWLKGLTFGLHAGAGLRL